MSENQLSKKDEACLRRRIEAAGSVSRVARAMGVSSYAVVSVLGKSARATTTELVRLKLEELGKREPIEGAA